MNKKESIENEILSMIKQGAAVPGDKLPSIRTLAQKYGVSMTPVTDAYSDLVAQRWVENRPHSGYYVAGGAHYADTVSRYHRRLELNATERYELMDDFLSGYSRVALNAGNDIDFSFGTTSAASSNLPISDFNRHHARCLRRSAISENYQARIHDEAELKKAVTKWMLPCRCASTAEDISIVRSVSEATSLSLRACAEPGSLIAIETPGHTGFYFCAKLFGYKVLPVPSCPCGGVDVDAFEELLLRGERPACLLLTANFSNPTGALMSDESKARLTSLCAREEIPIIEDDILGELSYSGVRPRPLKSFDDENVIYISGFGKCLNSAARTGYISAGRFKDAVAFNKHLATAYANPFLQLALAEYIESGAARKYTDFFAKRLGRMAESRRALLLDVFPEGTEVSSPKGGMNLWVTLPDGIDADSFSDRARSAGISVAPSRLFNAGEDMKSSFRFNFAAVSWTEEAAEAVRRLGDIARAMQRTRK